MPPIEFRREGLGRETAYFGEPAVGFVLEISGRRVRAVYRCELPPATSIMIGVHSIGEGRRRLLLAIAEWFERSPVTYKLAEEIRDSIDAILEAAA
jgi:hypothetical protein